MKTRTERGGERPPRIRCEAIRALELPFFGLAARAALRRCSGRGCFRRLLGGIRGQFLRFGRRLAVSISRNGGMCEQTERLAQVVLDLAANVGVFLQENSGIFA